MKCEMCGIKERECNEMCFDCWIKEYLEHESYINLNDKLPSDEENIND